MRTRSNLSWFFAVGSVGIACNAVFGLEQLEQKPPGGGGAEAGEGSGGTAGSGKGGSAGSAGSKGGSGGRGGTSTGGTAGESGGGMGGGGEDCTPDDEARCDAVDPTLVGNCAAGTVVCDENGSWGPCSVTPENADSCDVAGDDADCDGTENGGCPCVEGTERECGPPTEEGICEDGTQYCENEVWGPCEGAVFPAARDCLSPDDNDCDGAADNLRDDECPCAVDDAHVCVENAPADWDGPVAIATAAATGTSPSCTGTGYEVQAFTRYGAIDNGSATCGCTCATPTGSSCGPVNMQSGTVSCLQLQTAASPIEYPNMTPGGCTNVPASYNYYPGSQFTPGSCAAQPTSNFVRARFTRRVTGCGTNAGSAAGCSAAAECLPELDNPLESFCIYRDGDLACPSGPFTARTVYYDTVDDPRSCTACSCGAVSGSCMGHVDFTRQGSCPGSVLSTRINYGGCGNASDPQGFAIQATASTPMPTGSCPPNGGAVQGSVSTTGALTVCCMP